MSRTNTLTLLNRAGFARQSGGAIRPISFRRCHHRARAVMLLEVILAMTILFLGMAVIGIQLRTSVTTGFGNDRLTQGLMLAEAKLGQLDSGGINLQRELGADGIMEGDFGITFPGYFYRFMFEPHEDIEELFTMKLEILYETPEEDLEPGSIDDADVVMILHALRPTPAKLNLQRDFGFTEEQMDELTASLPPEVDPTDLSPDFMNEMDTDQLMEMLPMLMELFGQGFGFSTEQIQQAFDMGLLDPANLPTGELPEEILQGGGQRRNDREGRQ